jgi:hypothetical protein
MFGSGTSGYVNAVTVQDDGKILVGGNFFVLSSQMRNNMGRLNNSEPATQNMIYDGSTLTWLRGGTSPEICRASLEVSSDGTNWVQSGIGTRGAGGWQLTVVPPLTTNSTLRARGYVCGAYHNGSGWFVEKSLAVVPRLPPQILSGGSDFGVVSNQFGFSLAGLFGQVVVIEASTNLADWIPLQTNTLSGVPWYVSDSDWELFPQRFYRARLQ